MRRHGPEALALLAEAYARRGQNADASQIASKLHTAGYRHPDFLALLAEYPDLIQKAPAASAQGRP